MLGSVSAAVARSMKLVAGTGRSLLSTLIRVGTRAARSAGRHGVPGVLTLASFPRGERRGQGKRHSTMLTCQYCRTANRRSATYCNSCGGVLKGTPPNAPAPVAHPTPPPAHATVRPLPQTLLAGCHLLPLHLAQDSVTPLSQ